MSHDRRRSLVPPVLILALVALPLFVIFAYFLAVSVSIHASGTMTQGRVVSSRHYQHASGRRNSRHAVDAYTIAVEYTDRHGNQHQVTYDSDENVPAGTTTSVSYDNDHPDRAIVVGDQDTSIMRPVAFGLMFSIALLWGLASLARRRAHNRQLTGASRSATRIDRAHPPYWMRDGHGSGRE